MNSLTKIIVICVLGLSISLVLMIFVDGPILNQVNSLNASIKQKKNQATELDQQILAYQTAQNSLSKATRLSDITGSILTEDNLVSAVEEVEGAANTVQLKNETLQITDPITDTSQGAAPPPNLINGDQGIQEVQYDLTGQTDFPGMINLLSYLEHLPHFTEIGSLQFSSVTTGGNGQAAVRTGQIIGDFQGVFFTQTSNGN